VRRASCCAVHEEVICALRRQWQSGAAASRRGTGFVGGAVVGLWARGCCVQGLWCSCAALASHAQSCAHTCKARRCCAASVGVLDWARPSVRCRRGQLRIEPIPRSRANAADAGGTATAAASPLCGSLAACGGDAPAAGALNFTPSAPAQPPSPQQRHHHPRSTQITATVSCSASRPAAGAP
jgi:hypothetical protein